MSQAEYEAAVAAFLAKKTVTRCPTACVGPTQVSVAEKDREALRAHSAVRETVRTEKARSVQQHLAD